jgi:hypothetical protein
MPYILSVCRIERYIRIKAYVLTAPILKGAAPGVFSGLAMGLLTVRDREQFEQQAVVRGKLMNLKN